MRDPFEPPENSAIYMPVFLGPGEILIDQLLVRDLRGPGRAKYIQKNVTPSRKWIKRAAIRSYSSKNVEKILAADLDRQKLTRRSLPYERLDPMTIVALRCLVTGKILLASEKPTRSRFQLRQVTA